MGVEAVVALGEVEAGEFLDAFEAAVEGRSVDVQGLGRGGDVAAGFEQAFEGFEELGPRRAMAMSAIRRGGMGRPASCQRRAIRPQLPSSP